ncbi:protein NPAT [Pelodytes ibericus]
MLLPSDVARLVLGYLQQEKLTNTCRAFIAESPNLKEYAEHFSDEGFIPGCVLSLFGKNLTTILNEYVALKTKENKDEVPLMMSSLWKKLDHTLSQIRSMQESAAFQTHQRTRTRNGIEDIRRQRMLPLTASVPRHAVQQTSTPIVATQVVLCPLNTPSTSQASPLFGGQSTIQSNNSPVTISNGESLQIVSLGSSDRKQSSAVSSPMKRKNECQRRRRAAVATTVTLEGETGEDSDPLQELIDGNFPQMVIENAREKILSSKSLQEKLAENINKFLGSDSAAHASKPTDGGTVEQDTSIDEILGLQGGEIHMSEEVIHDILLQTELDPDFQQLYDLFACSSKASKSTPHDLPTQNEGAAQSNTAVDDSLDTVESSLETDAIDSPSHISNPSDTKQKDAESMVSDSSLQTTAHSVPSTPTNVTQISGTDTTVSSDQSFSLSGSQQSVNSTTVLDRTGSETIMEADKESQEAALGLSSDVEMINISQTDEVLEVGCQLQHRALSSASLEVEHLHHSKKGQSINTIPLAAKEHTSLEEINRGTPQCTTESQKPGLLVSAVPLVFKSVNPHKERDKHSVTITSCGDEVATPVHTDNCNTTTCTEQKASLKPALTEGTTHPKPVPKSRFVNPSKQLTSSAVGLSSQPEGTAVDLAADSSSQTVADPSQVITLNFVTDNTDTELSNAITAISGENFPAIILSPLAASQNRSTQESSVEVIAADVPGDRTQTVAQSSDASSDLFNSQAKDCTLYPVSAGSNPKADGGIIQLMPASSSKFGPSNSIFLSTCATKSNTSKQSNIMLLPNTSASAANQKPPCVYQTPPRPGNVYAVGKAISPNLPQGSTIILASPVQPVLQGVVGMIPVSVVGQSSNTFTASSHQVLHVPVSSSGIPKLPLQLKSQKPLPARSVASTVKPLTHLAADSTNLPPTSSVQRVENAEKKMISDLQQKAEERLVQDSTVKSTENHRRVLFFDTKRKSASPSTNMSAAQNKDKSTTVVASSADVCKTIDIKDYKRPEKSAGTSSKVDTVACTQVLVTVSLKDLPAEKKSVVDGPSLDGSSVVTSNKENLLQKESKTQGHKDLKKATAHNERSEKKTQSAQDVTKKMCVPNILKRTPQKVPPASGGLSSTLAKKASDILHGIQFHSPNEKQLDDGELPIPRTPGSGMDERLTDDPSTPTCKRYDDGGTPKPKLPTANSEFPTCSPASEAGSESSVNMAAHTLMILSRASMSKSGSNTPLKDNTQHDKSSKSSSKKRKIEETGERDRQSHKKELHSPILKKKKMKKHRKKSLDSFPAGMDVDKFLMSLHYDE